MQKAAKMELEKDVDLHQKIAEIKKRILLTEGQKTANAAEWQKQSRINSETLSTLKKENKDLTSQMVMLKNPINRPMGKDLDIEPGGGKPLYPVGAKSPEEAVFLMDLKITENRKQLDLLRHRFQVRQKYFNKLVQHYEDLLAYKEHQSKEVGGKPPETLEEDANRKLVIQLENEIHRKNVKWNEAEHIKKKYKSIQASLMADAERFERSLKELEEALAEQQTEINRLQQVHNEALEMRDVAKVILQRQEQQANTSLKIRERQALDFRKQVESRKMELERIGRKLFTDAKTFVHQDSIGSSSGDQQTGKTEHDDDPNSQLQSVTTDMETLFKELMEVTGATSPSNVLERFLSQKESSLRLTYLRNAAESEKTDLETQRENLTKELETSKFSEMKESEVNQEVVEKLKLEISNMNKEKQKNDEAASRTVGVIKFIQDRLRDMIYKLQEVDESDVNIVEKCKSISAQSLPDFLVNDATDEDLIDILKAKLERSLQSQGEKEIESLQKSGDVEVDELAVRLEQTPSITAEDKPQPMPMCYYNLVSGRATRTLGTSSGSPEQGPAPAVTDDESEVPSRNFLKRQSVVIVDTKSRRKAYRPVPQRRK
ncbi:A-kinase anchor protein 9 isoform X2 [Episyrphus balteatus]|uniref:A-kinase anchor protein 9 isoform X2 n=1 Tax=Episyrphus balteatus TaxID=286459 RepID=UPI002486521B|nr:A-kinase anchor protein 9 isoform X2 [Episyrphus balteatus]